MCIHIYDARTVSKVIPLQTVSLLHLLLNESESFGHHVWLESELYASLITTHLILSKPLYIYDTQKIFSEYGPQNSNSLWYMQIISEAYILH